MGIEWSGRAVFLASAAAKLTSSEMTVKGMKDFGLEN